MTGLALLHWWGLATGVAAAVLLLVVVLQAVRDRAAAGRRSGGRLSERHRG